MPSVQCSDKHCHLLFSPSLPFLFWHNNFFSLPTQKSGGKWPGSVTKSNSYEGKKFLPSFFLLPLSMLYTIILTKMKLFATAVFNCTRNLQSRKKRPQKYRFVGSIFSVLYNEKGEHFWNFISISYFEIPKTRLLECLNNVSKFLVKVWTNDGSL